MRLLILSWLLLICSCAAQDAARRALDDAKSLADQGNYESALAKHVWFHDHALEANRGLYGVRLSFALSAWVELGGKFPKALETLRNIRDAKTARLLAGEMNRELFHDVESINSSLGESASTASLFKRLENANPDFAAALYDLADEALLEAREYVLAKKYLGDPAKRLARARRNFESGLEFAKSHEKADASRRAFESIFVTEVKRIITILQETGDEAAAREIQTEALKTLDHEAIRKAVKVALRPFGSGKIACLQAWPLD